MRTCVLCFALAACSFPTKPGPPFGCVGDDLPDIAPDTIHVRGTVIDPFRDRLLSGATETGFVIASPDPLRTFTETTDSAGSFTASEMTGGAPHAQFIQSRAAGYLDTFGYPALPVAGDITATLQQIDQEELGELASAGGLTLDPAKAFLIASVVNCNDDAVAGAKLTVTTSNPSDVIEVTYFANGMPDRTARQTDAATGAAFVTGLTPGVANLHASFGTTPYRDHGVTTKLGALTLTEISP